MWNVHGGYQGFSGETWVLVVSRVFHVVVAVATPCSSMFGVQLLVEQPGPIGH